MVAMPHNKINQKKHTVLKLITLAKNLEGTPYKYGATMTEAPKFFDCSLFTQYLFKEINVSLPRTAIEQAMVGRRVSLQKIKEGDLVFVKGEIGRYNKYFPMGIGHVGLYLGEGNVIHADRKRFSGKYENLYNPKLIREFGNVIIEDLHKFLKRKKPLIVIKRYI